MLTQEHRERATKLGIDLGTSRRGEPVRYCVHCGSPLPRYRKRPELIGLSLEGQSRLACPQRQYHKLPDVRHVRGARSARVHGPLRTVG